MHFINMVMTTILYTLCFYVCMYFVHVSILFKLCVYACVRACFNIIYSCRHVEKPTYLLILEQNFNHKLLCLSHSTIFSLHLSCSTISMNPANLCFAQHPNILLCQCPIAFTRLVGISFTCHCISALTH